MRGLAPSLLLFAAVHAQQPTPSQSLNLIATRAPSSVVNIEPSAIPSVAPVQPDQACAQISRLVDNSRSTFPSVPAELAIYCLKSVPISRTAANTTITALKKMVEFQSTLSYLKDPPQGYPNEKVDIQAGLDDIAARLRSNQYTNEYDFEEAIASLFIKAHDGHLSFNGMAWAGAFRWRRSSQIALISASRDGRSTPQIWALGDFNKTDTSFQPSPVTRINGQGAREYLEQEAAFSSYHDPDTRFNAMFFMQPAENFGYFTNPRFFSGISTEVTFENGTSRNYTNSAIVLEREAWSFISDPESFYDTYISPVTSSQRIKKRDPNALPLHLDNPRDHEFLSAFTPQHGSAPFTYPRPFVAHSAPQVPLAGYFINTAQGQIGVLVVQTYNTEDVTGAREYQRIIQRYIAEARTRGVAKHIIDVRANGGGKVLNGYDMYLQFFPSQKPQSQSRYRGHRASELFGSSISTFSLPTTSSAERQLYTSPFSNEAFLSANLTAFADWNAMYPPVRFKNDNFTALLRYNLSDPLSTSDAQTATGIVPTGYGNRANFTEDPFRAEDIIILSDGLCASTCAVFLELMVQQSGVRTLTVGGRHQDGPTVPVGGVKGSLVIPYEYLITVSNFIVLRFARTTAQAREWATFLPSPFGIAVQDASVNFQDQIRKGLESDGIPTQFLNDTSSCRIWYEPQMLINVTRLWEKTAAVAWGGSNSRLNETACIAGSVSSRQQQTGGGEGNPGTSGGNATTGGGDKKDAAAGLRPGWPAVVICGLAVMVSLVWS